MKLKSLALCLALLSGLPFAAQAQSSPFQAAITVNNVGITYYEIGQRARMLQVLGTLGDVEKQARDALIDDRVQHQAAKTLGVSVTNEELQAGMEEFASRANLNAEQLLAEFAKAGVDPETFTDFVRAGLEWRHVIVQKFQSKAFISEAELNTALALGATSLGASVLMSELVIPLAPGQETQAQELADDLSKRLKTAAEFEDAVLTYSAAPSRADGGKIDWIPIGNLPPEIGTLFLTRGVGAITPPVKLPNAVAIFLLRGLRDARTAGSKTVGYEYATFQIAGGRSEAALKQAAEISASVDTCKDLAAKVRKLPENLFSQQTLPIAKVPRDIALELARLDNNEISTNLTSGPQGENLVLLMLCQRTTALTSGNREEVRTALFNQRMEAFGTGYLQELRSDAVILNK